DRNRSHWSTSKTPSYTKSVSWQHHLNSNSNIIKTPPRKTNTEKALKTYTETLTGKILTESTKNKNINHAISEHQAAQLFNLFLLLNLTKYPIYSVMRFSSTNA
ncbi:hypothetical protein PO439_19400, partial [Escherichia coli]